MPETTHTLTPEVLEQLVRDSIERNRGVRRETQSQSLIDQAIAAAYDEGEHEIAAGLLVLTSARITGHQHGALQVLMQHAVDERQTGRWRRDHG